MFSNKMFAIAAVIAAVGAVATLGSTSVLQQASADPQEAHGRCFSNNGVDFGCAGNVGGVIIKNGECRQINQGPFNEFSCK